MLSSPLRDPIKVILALAALSCALPARGQEGVFRLSLDPGPISEAAPPVPAPSAADNCAAVPAALGASAGGAYDPAIIACFNALASSPDYVSPLAGAPAPLAPLTAEEKAAVDKYVDSYAYIVNAALRQGADVSKYRKFIKTLDSGLLKMPAYRGVTFRGSAYPPAPADGLLPGAVFTDPAFLSTTRNLSVAENYTGQGGYLSVILSRTGRLISYDNFLDGLDTEMEVLFRAGSKFRVIAVSGRPSGGKAVYLEELP